MNWIGEQQNEVEITLLGVKEGKSERVGGWFKFPNENMDNVLITLVPNVGHTINVRWGNLEY